MERNETYPDIIASLDQFKRQTSMPVRKTDPNLGIHEKAMVHVNHLLVQACRSRVDLLPLLALLPRQAMKAEEIAILGLGDVLLCLVSPDPTQLDKISCVPHRC